MDDRKLEGGGSVKFLTYEQMVDKAIEHMADIGYGRLVCRNPDRMSDWDFVCQCDEPVMEEDEDGNEVDVGWQCWDHMVVTIKAGALVWDEERCREAIDDYRWNHMDVDSPNLSLVKVFVDPLGKVFGELSRIVARIEHDATGETFWYGMEVL